MSYPFSRALVTGSTGFIGSHLVSALVKEGIEVHGIGLPSSENQSHADHVTMHYGDITDPNFLMPLLQEMKPEVVFHLAAYGTFGHEKDVQRMIQVNIQGTHSLLDASIASGCKAFIMAGSAKEYATGRTPISENQALLPWDEYAATKAAAGFFCHLAAEKHAIPVTVLRLAAAYGPGDSLNRFIPVAIKAALSGEPFTISAGSLVRNFTYIDDVVDIFLQASLRTTPGYEVCNVAYSKSYSFSDVLQAVETVTGKTIEKITPPAASSKDDSWVLDATKAKQLLNWEARVSLEEGVRKTVEWYTAL